MEGGINCIDSPKTFIYHDNKASIPKKYKLIVVQVVVDIKYDGRRKARLVSGGHLADKDTTEKYSGVISVHHVR